jgi:hypothetical protein
MQDSKELLLYITVNNVNGKVYGGKHIGNRSDNYIGSGTARFKHAVKKYGKLSFTRKWLRIKIKNEEDLNRKEIRLIRLLKHFFKSNCYNIHEGGTGGYMLKYSDDTIKAAVRKRISEGKKLQYKIGATVAQIEGWEKRYQKIKGRYHSDDVYRLNHMQRMTAGNLLKKERHQKFGLTENELRGSSSLKEHGQFKIRYKISLPDGTYIEHVHNHSKFCKHHYMEDTVYTAIHTTGTFTVKRRTPKTRHTYPVGTVFTMLGYVDRKHPNI